MCKTVLDSNFISAVNIFGLRQGFRLIRDRTASMAGLVLDNQRCFLSHIMRSLCSTNHCVILNRCRLKIFRTLCPVFNNLTIVIRTWRSFHYIVKWWVCMGKCLDSSYTVLYTVTTFSSAKFFIVAFRTVLMARLCIS